MRVLTLFLAALAMVYFTACSDKKENGDNTATSPGPGACSSSNQLFCIDPDLPPLAPGQLATWGNSLQITKSSTFEKLMEEHGGFCRRSNFFGNWDCGNYTSAGYVIIEADPGQPEVVTFWFGAGASKPPGGYYDYNLGFNNYFYEFPVHNVQMWRSNNDQGMEFVGNGVPNTYSWSATTLNEGLHGIVEQGTLADDSFVIVLRYRGTQFATAHVTRLTY